MKAEVYLRSEERLGVLAPFLLNPYTHNTDVRISTRDGKYIRAHSCVLRESSVLLSWLECVDVRVSQEANIHMDFSQNTVQALVNFLYQGNVNLDISFKSEFIDLCRALRLNPRIKADPLADVAETLEEPAAASRKPHEQPVESCPLAEELVESIPPAEDVIASGQRDQSPVKEKPPETETSSFSTANIPELISAPLSTSGSHVATCDNPPCDQDGGEDGDEYVEGEASSDSPAQAHHVPEDIVFPCDICNRIFISESAQEMHMKTEHITDDARDVSYDETPESIEVFLNELNKEHVAVSNHAEVNVPLMETENQTRTSESEPVDQAIMETNPQPATSKEAEAKEDSNSSSPALENQKDLRESAPDAGQISNIQQVYVPANTEPELSESTVVSHSAGFKDIPEIVANSSSFNEDLSDGTNSDGFFSDFRMPENFDFPQDLIQEISPKKRIDLKPEERMASLGVPSQPIPSSLIEPTDSSINHELNQPSAPKVASSKGDEEKVPSSKQQQHEKRPEKQGNQEPAKPGKKAQEPCTPEQDKDITTYYSREHSSKSTKSTKRCLAVDAKRNRKINNLLSDVFGEGSQESEGTAPTPRTKKPSSQPPPQLSETKGAGSVDRTTPMAELREELEEKKDRVKKRLVETDSDETNLYKEKRKKKKVKKPARDREKPATSSSQPKSKSEAKPKAPFKFENDHHWLVPDSYEDSSDSEKKAKDKKRKKKKKPENSDDQDSSDDDDRRKRLNERKQRKGGDVLSWMSRRKNVLVKYQEHGRETIVDKAIYKMNLIGSEESSSSGIDEEIKKRKRNESPSDRGRSRSPSHPRTKFKKAKKKKRKKDRRRSVSSGEERRKVVRGEAVEEEKEKRTLMRWHSLQEEPRRLPPIFKRSTSTFGSNSFKIPKINKKKSSESEI